MKTLIVYYSRTGTTATAAKDLAAALGADIEELIDKRDRSGVVGYLGAGREAMKKSLTEIEFPKYNPAVYDLVVIASPVWAWNMSSAARTYINLYRDKLPRTAFLITQGGTNDQKVVEKMAELLGRADCAGLWFTTKEVRDGAHRDKLAHFADTLKS